jgi:hypothetical protein
MPKTWRLRTTGAQVVSPMRMLGLALVLPLLWAGRAEARREQAYPYTFERVWTTAVRLLRIDFSSPITEKDKDSGYFLFDFTDGKAQHPGSMELIRITEAGAESVRVVLQIPALPSYVEQTLLERLSRKLGQEYGTPIGAKPAPPPKHEPAARAKPTEPGSPAVPGTNAAETEATLRQAAAAQSVQGSVSGQ